MKLDKQSEGIFAIGSLNLLHMTGKCHA